MRSHVVVTRWFLALAMVGLGCGEPPNPPSDRCAGVHCPGVEICNAQTGQCEARPVDAGTDAGADAGAPVDAGFDAGTDAGFDAGTDAVLDAGTDGGAGDAGFDAGTIDAGCGSDGDCFGVQHCDPQTRACVECVTSAHCLSSVVPVCDLRVHQCVGCVANADCVNPTPICDPSQQCLPCNSSAECGAGRECNAFTFACDPLNDSCSSARAILAAGTGSLAISAEPALALDDTTSGCGAAGPELVYTFTTTTTQAFTASATPQLGSSVRPALYLRSGCAGATLGCDAPTSGGASLSVAMLPAGTYFLFVEALNATPGRLTLAVSLQPPPASAANDTCSSPSALGLNGASVTHAIAVGNTTLANNESTTEPVCSVTARSGPDVVFGYTLAAQSNVTFTARPLQGSSLHPVLSVRSTCASGEVGCQAASAATSVQASLVQDAGTYFVWVDSADGTSGAFQLEADAIPIVGNDACALPQALAFDAGVATATGDTRWATNGNVGADQSPGCSLSARSTGRDLVYSYVLGQAQDVTLVLTPTGASPSYEPVLSVRAASCSDGTSTAERGCVSPVSAAPARLDLVNQPAGTYFVWVDSGRDTAGPFQLEVDLAPATPPPANDSCASPQALTFSNGVATFSGSTLQAANDNAPGDVSPTCNATAKQNGRDVVYQFTLGQQQDVAIAVSAVSGSTLIPSLYVRRSSCTSQLLVDELACSTAIGTASTQLTRLAAGTYYLWVDSSANTAGAFTGSVTLAPPTPAPANDDCPGQLLTFSGSPATAIVDASTVAAANSNSPTDNAPACGDNFFPRRFGRDLVYRFTTTSPQDVELTVTPGASSGLVPALYVRSPNQCTSFSAGFELTCLAQTSVAPVREVLVNQPPGTYSVFVDSNSAGAGDFRLAVTLRPASSPPANDACAAPAMITPGPTGVSGDTTTATDSYSSIAYGSPCRRFFFDGRDLVYQVVAATTGTMTATVTPEAAFNPSLLLLEPTCGPALCVRAVEAAPAGVAESFSFPVTQGQSYFLVVDSASRELPGAFGRFTLTVQ